MENEEFSEDQFIIYLTIEGSNKEEVPLWVTDQSKTISDQIDKIIQVLKLPKMDGGGNPITYQLGRVISGGEPIILRPEDEDGLKQCLMDYNIQSGDHLHLYALPIAG